MSLDPVTHHAVAQAAARYGIAPAWEEWERARQAIIAAVLRESSDAVLLKRGDDGGERWLVRLGDDPVIAIYRPEDALIVTVLPADAKRRPNPLRRQNLTGRGRHERERADIEA